jgi:hypothetical protein
VAAPAAAVEAPQADIAAAIAGTLGFGRRPVDPVGELAEPAQRCPPGPRGSRRRGRRKLTAPPAGIGRCTTLIGKLKPCPIEPAEREIDTIGGILKVK